MKTINVVKKSLLILITVIGLWGCGQEFLNRPPLDALTSGAFYNNDAELFAHTATLYSFCWFDYNDKNSFILGDGRGGIFYTGSNASWYQTARFTNDANSETVLQPWTAFYNVVGQSNTVINNVKAYTKPAVTDEAKKQATAEARFMRGVAYSYLVRTFGAVPIITNNNVQLTDTSLARNTIESIWEFIIRDLRYASQNLPSVPYQPGRLSKWSAEGMLAKMYLSRSGVLAQNGVRNQADLDSAKYYAGDVCKNSGLSLMPNYEDLFKTQFNTSKGNNQEGLFALQWVFGGPYNTGNTIQAQLAINSQLTGAGDGWGGTDKGATVEIMKYYDAHPEDSIRRKASYMFPGEIYPYMHYEDNTVKDANGNPSIVIFTVPSSVTMSTVKKYIVGRPEDNNNEVAILKTTINTYMLRLSEVYLIYAEAILGNDPSTSDADALTYFNMVRTRAKMPQVASINWDDIFQERTIEFAMEGVRWNDMVNLYYYNPVKALGMINSQDRGRASIAFIPGSSPKKWLFTYDPNNAVIPGQTGNTKPVDAGNFYLQIPSSEITKAPNLYKTPVPFTNFPD